MTLQEQIARARGVETQARAACCALGLDPDEPMVSGAGLGPGIGYVSVGSLPIGGLNGPSVPRWAIVAESLPVDDLNRLNGST
jgi:hypothetical protein